MIINSGKHYLYRHIRPDKNEVFYVGIGTKCKESNPYARSKSKFNKGPYWKNIAKTNPDYKIEIILESDNYEFIKNKEREFIKLYGRKDLGLGTLSNMTDGGNGTKGAIRTKEWQEKIVTIYE